MDGSYLLTIDFLIIDIINASDIIASCLL